MTTYQVTAHNFNDELVALVLGLRNRREAGVEAARLFNRADVNRVAVTEQPPRPPGNGRYR